MEMVDNRKALEADLRDDQGGRRSCSTRPTIRTGTWTCRRRSTTCRSSNETAKRNILGGNALRLFNLEPVLSEAKLARKAAGAAEQQPEINKVYDIASSPQA